MHRSILSSGMVLFHAVDLAQFHVGLSPAYIEVSSFLRYLHKLPAEPVCGFKVAGRRLPQRRDQHMVVEALRSGSQYQFAPANHCWAAFRPRRR